MEKKVNVIGGGLAGVEAAYYIASCGYQVKLYEMRPNPKAFAHHSNLLGELVCSNSLKSKKIDNAAGLLKEELKELNSLVMQAAMVSEVAAGNALAVDRTLFAQFITDKLKTMSNIEIIHEEVTKIPQDEITIIATGPLTADTLASSIKDFLGEKHLYFYDAAAPLIDICGIDESIVYRKSRYDKGGDDYLNCPFTKEEFELFYKELCNGIRVPLKDFEKEIHFEGCMPIETMAQRGAQTLRFGPMKPVGLTMPDGTKPFAVIQLRQDNQRGNLYNIVGFQTNLTFKEQERIFSLIPGLKNIKIIRYGVMHRNTYILSPLFLNDSLSCKKNSRIFFAGQLTGIEGYIESAVTGIIAGINAIRQLENKEMITLPLETITGSLIHYIVNANINNFQPMNANYGILINYNQDKLLAYEKSIKELRLWKKVHGINL